MITLALLRPREEAPRMGTRSFVLSATLHFLHPLLTYVNEPKALDFSPDYHVDVSANIRMNEMPGRMGENMFKLGWNRKHSNSRIMWKG